MNKDELELLVEQGDEIEFEFSGKRFSIIYLEIDGEDWISFCEFYKETTEVKTVDELLKVERYGVTVEEMLASCTEEDIWLF